MTATDAPTSRDMIAQVIDAARSGDLARARALAIAALSKGAEHPLLLNLRALDHEEAGRLDASLADLRRAHILSPKDFSILNACGLCLGRMHRNQEALDCFDQALELQPGFGPAWFNRGWALEHLGRTAEANQSYLKAVELNPENAQAWANMAQLAVRRGDLAAARASADRALALQPGFPSAELALSQAEMAEPSEAERRLSALLTRTLGPFDEALANGLLGDALDALDRTDEAFEAYARGNALFRKEAAPRFEAAGQPTIPSTLNWLLRWTERLPPEHQRPKSGAGRGGEAGHVFLMGFPRSGTTLAETVLLNHPDIVSLEEKNTLDAGVLDFLTGDKALDRLRDRSEADLDRYRDDYWERVRGFGVDPKGKFFIDKNPFNATKLPLIYKLFPSAKILFAIRDPRDVVWSCYRRRFVLNASTYEFLNLQRTAEYYAGSMRMAEMLRFKQPMDEHRLIYEKLVEDLPGVTRAACDFIGAEWRDDMLDVAARARRGDVGSASSAQIARGLYSDGAGQWRRYARHLAPIMPTLAPWIERFGYPAS